MKVLQTRVLVLGGGATGAGVVRDLALRGVECILAERRDINAGASGGNHGLLHSGARYVASDMEAAIECREEGALLKRLAPQCIEDTGGLFVAVEGDDTEYIDNFQTMCERSGISARQLDVKEAREMEPVLSERTMAAYEVPDASVDPFMLSLDNVSQAISLGTTFLRNAKVVGFEREDGVIKRTRLMNEKSGEEFYVEADVIVNATGAWAGHVAQLAGATIRLLYSSGTLAITQNRLAKRVVNRLRRAADSDILVPGGTVSILGTTSVNVADPDICQPTVAEVDRIIDDAREMIPALETTRYIRAYAGVRPLVLAGEAGDARSVSRGFSLIDHAADAVDNFVTITGGKLTTYRLMAERTADMVCRKIGVSAPCLTALEPLPASVMGKWTEPGLGPQNWIQNRQSDDLMLCECEMVSTSVINEIVANLGDLRGEPTLQAVGMRSRVGKGPCQGGGCGLRITSHLYDIEHHIDQNGIEELRRFVDRRWRGYAPVQWGMGKVQGELQEAMYCGGMDMELDDVSHCEDEA